MSPVVPDRGHRLVGPILSTRNRGRHRELLVEVFGLVQDDSIEVDAAQARALWAVDVIAANAELYLTPGTQSGVLLVQLDPPSPRCIRDRRRGDEHDALKVVDFHATDFDASLDELAARGFAVRDSIADYEMPEGRFREAHLWTEDEVVYALLDGPADFMGRVVQVTDRPFSEVMSVSTPTRARDAAMRFYREVLDFEDVYRYGFDDDSFGALVEVPDLGACIEATRNWPDSLLCPPTEIALGSFGRVSSALLRAPHGITHQLLQRI